MYVIPFNVFLNLKILINQSIISKIKSIITGAKYTAIRAVNKQRTLIYWLIGKRIFEEEQQGKDGPDYGTYPLIKVFLKK
ncbi:DUF1016 N-terminal domain-containing protein [Flavobacterium sp.]|uniref:DUF1016 N-terminal domain-containing protein n=1 Tax=Flavobacterium sp. TaxID=239 RepID=UPI0038FC0364